ncbi:MAG TPA: YceH family protein, partial [Acidimicrobiales bacterium]|nr:YceH family protein [Acidimicrobiales bacterium]
MRLSPEEARVTGSLIEKELTTPQQYPLTQNALLLACNQSSNRDPVVDYNERTVDSALAALKTAGLVRYVHPSHGRSVTRYQHLLGDQLGLNGPQLALVAVLMLRGPQTAGELRSRTERMCEFDGISDVELELELLNTLPEPLVARLARRPGQKEERWVQLLTGPSAVPVVPEGPSEPGGAATGQAGDSGPGARVTSGLAAQVAELRAELSELRDQL